MVLLLPDIEKMVKVKKLKEEKNASLRAKNTISCLDAIYVETDL